MNKVNGHFVDCDIAGTASGEDAWTSNNYSFPANDPTKIGISTMEELALIGNDAGYPMDGDYELTANLDADGIVFWPIGRPASNRDQIVTFTGTFDGRFYTISNIAFTQADHFDNTNSDHSFGLFAKSTAGSQIDNINITGMSITSTSQLNTIGLLIGNGTNITVNNCHTQGTITMAGTASNNIGGVIGTGPATLTRCSANIVITSSGSTTLANVGGLVGTASGTYTDCYAQGSIEITGTPTNGLNLVGGFGGLDSGGNTFVRCYSAMTITGKELFAVGGFLGLYDEDVASTFTDNFWDSTIETGKSDVGHQGEATDSPNSSPADVDGITKGTSGDDGVYDMYKEATFTNWDFGDIWQIDEDAGYPTHQWEDANPLQIKTGEQNRTTAFPQDHAHLNGETVQVLGDGSYLGTEAVTSGGVDLDDDTTVNHVGLQITTKIQPMKLDGEARVKRISQIIPNVNNTVGGKYGRSEAELKSMVLRTSSDIMDTDGELYTGYVELPFDGTYDRSGDIWITQDEPFPLHLLGIGIRMSNEAI